MEEIILQKLQSIEKQLKLQNLLQKEILTHEEAALYLGRTESNLYKLTSIKMIPLSCPPKPQPI